MKTLVIGIAGGSGSGKSTIAQKIINAVGPERIAVLEMDSYYKDLSHLSLAERSKTNFDHPNSTDIELFTQHVKDLKAGREVKKPTYDFVTHTRRAEYTIVRPQPVIIVEGILLYENSDVRKLIDVKTYVETPSDVRFIRRLLRDINERGRTPDSVVTQYYETVRPMHMTFVDPSREHADIIIPWQDYNQVAVDVVIHRIESCLK